MSLKWYQQKNFCDSYCLKESFQEKMKRIMANPGYTKQDNKIAIYVK